MNKFQQNATCFRIAVFALSSILAVVGMEICLRHIPFASTYLLPKTVPDPILGLRVKPGSPGHDENGFRNQSDLRSVEVLAVGDSQTWGVNALPQESWPKVVEKELGLRVYSCSMGGFGPMEYLHLTKIFVSRVRPKIVVWGLYLGNDFADSERSVYEKEIWQAWRQKNPPLSSEQKKAGPSRILGGIRDFLSQNSILYQGLRNKWLTRLRYYEQTWLSTWERNEELIFWRPSPDKGQKTVFNPSLRLGAENTDIPSIKEGLEICKKAIATANQFCLERNTTFIVMLIPTKELAFSALAEDVKNKKLCDLVEREQENRVKMVHYCAQIGVAVFDALPCLQDGLRANLACYRTDEDGHPTSMGYMILGKSLANILRKNHGLSGPGGVTRPEKARK